MITRSLPIQSNKETFSDIVEVTDDDGNVIAFADIDEIYVSVRDLYCNTVILKARKTESTVTERDDGTAEFSFTPAQMGALCSQNYEFSILVTVGGVTKQTHRCNLPVVEGPR